MSTDALFRAAVTRLQPLPTFGPSGASLAQQLVYGRDEAARRLRKYRPDFRFDPNELQVAVRTVDAWLDRNAPAVTSELESGAHSLPEEIALNLGAAPAQNFLIAGYVMAAYGLGPWMSGELQRYAARQELVNADWARQDATARLQTFGIIVKLDDAGELDRLFRGGAVSGFGFVVPLIIIVVALIAAVVVYLIWTKDIDEHNRTIREICNRAFDAKNQPAINSCLEAAQKAGLSSQLAGVAADVLGKVAIVGTLGVMAYLALPMVERRLAARASGRTAA